MEMEKSEFKSIQQMTELKCHPPQHFRGKVCFLIPTSLHSHQLGGYFYFDQVIWQIKPKYIP